jgi:hypothetical protein
LVELGRAIACSTKSQYRCRKVVQQMGEMLHVLVADGVGPNREISKFNVQPMGRGSNGLAGRLIRATLTIRSITDN